MPPPPRPPPGHQRRFRNARRIFEIQPLNIKSLEPVFQKIGQCAITARALGIESNHLPGKGKWIRHLRLFFGKPRNQRSNIGKSEP